MLRQHLLRMHDSNKMYFCVLMAWLPAPPPPPHCPAYSKTAGNTVCFSVKKGEQLRPATLCETTATLTKHRPLERRVFRDVRLPGRLGPPGGKTSGGKKTSAHLRAPRVRRPAEAPPRPARRPEPAEQETPAVALQGQTRRSLCPPPLECGDPTALHQRSGPPGGRTAQRPRPKP